MPRAARQAVDPVCGMTVTVGPDTAHAVVDGVDHWFCNTGCRDRFLADARVTGPVSVVVLAAGGSRRLGQPKQLLAFRGATLLDATLATARAAGADQVVVALGGAADEVPSAVDLAGLDVVLNPDFGDGCATSIRTALTRVRDDADGVVLLLGDQPGVTVETVQALVAGATGHAVGVCAYDDGRATRCGSIGACSRRCPACTATRRSGSWSRPTTTSCTSRSPARCRATSTPGTDYQALLGADG